MTPGRAPTTGVRWSDVWFVAYPGPIQCSAFFFFNDTATTEIYTLSLHDALPIFSEPNSKATRSRPRRFWIMRPPSRKSRRSEEHTSELQSRLHLVCRLLLEKKK